MSEFGWRTLVIDSKCALSLENNNIRINGEEVKLIPIEQIREILINTLEVSITSALIVKLNEYNISIIFCNCKKNPCLVTQSLESERKFSSSLFTQLSWTDANKKIVWNKIIEQKISNQISVLDLFEIEVPNSMHAYREITSSNKINSCEASAARVYFKTLFGKNFKRHSNDNINSALNYGYSLLLSSFNRILVSHGYNTCLGINHRSETNPFNLSCDLMEPFRPFIDIMVFLNKGAELNGEFKKSLINSVYQSVVKFDGKSMRIQDAAELYCLDILSHLNGTNNNLMKEVYI